MPIETNKEINKLYLPALRGQMGDWVYYSCLISLMHLERRVSLVKDFHPDTTFSERIQRDLDEKRTLKIAEYIKNTQQRFFNSLVIAVYEGNPKWLPFDDIALRESDSAFEEAVENFPESLGFLYLSGKERLFAVDGQHRVAGFKKYIETVANEENNESNDIISILLVSHIADDDGKKRTRRLFTTLNKYAKPVSKKDIILLDEDDLCAVLVRKLIEEHSFFKEDKIAIKSTKNTDSTDKKAIMTIIGLYDLLQTLFIKTNHDLTLKKGDYETINISDEIVEKYYQFSLSFFNLMCKSFQEIGEFFDADADKVENIISKYRNSHILYRPVGWNIIVGIISDLSKSKKHNYKECFKIIKKLPIDLDSEPYQWLIWNPDAEIMISKKEKTVQNVLLYMLGEYKGKEEDLKEDYKEAGGKDAGYKSLPKKIV